MSWAGTAEDADVAIVGASLAGLRAAHAAAAAGARTILLEARRRLDEPPPLASLAFDALLPHDAHVPASHVRARIEGVELRSPGGHAIRLEAPARVLDRAAFDAHLLARAQAVGATARLGTGAIELRPASGPGRRHELAAHGVLVAAKVVVFADGAASQARRLMATVRDPGRVVWGAAHEVAASSDAAWATIRVGSHARGGRTQTTPAGAGRALHWSFTGTNPHDAVATARQNLALEHGPEALAAARLVGAAPDPVYTVPHRLVADGALACGGAAGQGGIEVGLASGRMAGEAAAAAARTGRTRRRDLLGYERAWRKRYLRGYVALRRATDLVARQDDAQLDRLFAPLAGKRLALDEVRGLTGSAAARLRALALLARSHRGALPAILGALARRG